MKGTIRIEEVDACLLCGEKGKTLYNGLCDQNYGTSGLWNFYHCSQCNLVWLSPRPAVEDMSKFYPSCYGTHAIPQKKAVERLKQELWLAVIAKSFGYSELLIKNTRRRAIGWLLNTVPLYGKWQEAK